MYKSLQQNKNRAESIDIYDKDDEEIDYFDDQISDENIPNMKS